MPLTKSDTEIRCGFRSPSTAVRNTLSRTILCTCDETEVLDGLDELKALEVLEVLEVLASVEASESRWKDPKTTIPPLEEPPLSTGKKIRLPFPETPESAPLSPINSSTISEASAMRLLRSKKDMSVVVETMAMLEAGGWGARHPML